MTSALPLNTNETQNGEKRELDRIREAYAKRHKDIPADRYARTNPAQLNALHSQENAFAALSRSACIASFAGLRILDAGCGAGSTLRQLLEYGADPALLTGIDLMPERVREAPGLAPHLHVVCGSASRLPFAA